MPLAVGNKPVITDYIQTDRQLAKLCNAILADADAAIGIDTEFVRTNTYHPILALIQLSTSDSYYIIDPLTIANWQPFIAVLSQPDIAKVLHSPLEDMDVFSHQLDCYPQNIFDTQIAANVFLQREYIGYANLVELQFNRQLDKSATRSDWLQRPLTEVQLDYAINDIIWLLPLYRQFKLLGEEQPQLWQQAIGGSDKLIDKAKQPKIHDLLYKKVRNHQKLSIEQLQLLQQMCVWREQTAQQYNKPKAWIIHDKFLIKLIRMSDRQTISKATLLQLEGYSKASVRHYGQAVIDQLRHFKQLAINSNGAVDPFK